MFLYFCSAKYYIFLYKKVLDGRGEIDKLLLYKRGYFAPNGNLSKFVYGY